MHRPPAESRLYRAYKEWCASTGREKSAVDESTFGRDLRAVDPKITTTRPRSAGARLYHYAGIDLAANHPGNDAADATPF
ncbi:MAG TPA: hypothetical protein VKP69_12250 [Isosphaeraceae bacterium]|nr:hypothetical protein [Isosphaeraceae bacterium]